MTNCSDLEQDDAKKIAIDIGYGDVKVMCGNECFKFSSTIEREGTYAKGLALDEFKESNVYSFNGSLYKVAQQNSFKAIATRNIEFLLKYSPILIHHAIKRLGIKDIGNYELITGLSIVNLEHSKDFIKTVREFEVDGQITKFKSVLLRPQGRGIYDDYDGDKSGLVFVVDIGFNTLDMLAYRDGNYVLDLNFADRNGANRVVSSLRKRLSNDFPRMVFSEQFAKEIFSTGIAEFGGQEHDYVAVIEELKQEYSEFLVSHLMANESIIMANKVIISGGGAYFVDFNLLKEEMPNVVSSKEPYEFSNVRGYYNAKTK